MASSTPPTRGSVAELQVIFALMIPAYTLSQLLSRVLNAMRATRYLLIGSIVIFTFNIVADYLFKEWFGITGIAMATVGNYMLALVLQFLPLPPAHRRPTGPSRVLQMTAAASPSSSRP